MPVLMGCDQESIDNSGVCYFHRKRIEGLIEGVPPGPGLGRQFRESDARGKAVIAALIEKEGSAVNTPREEAREKARRRMDEEIYPALMEMAQRLPEDAPLLER